MEHLGSTGYGWLTLAGVVLTIVLWSRLARRDERLVFIYIAALAGAFIGAKLVYFAAEGWLHWSDQDRWARLATGKSIIGGLLGGYVTVEITKRIVHYRETTGDRFAIVAPIGIMLGRVGCVLHGCCLGRPFEASWLKSDNNSSMPLWPAAAVELLFNAAALGTVLLFRRRDMFCGQHFHLYLIAYGVFRFVHEFFRATPSIVGPITGYQVAALVLLAFGIGAFAHRQKQINRIKTKAEV